MVRWWTTTRGPGPAPGPVRRPERVSDQPRCRTWSPGSVPGRASAPAVTATSPIRQLLRPGTVAVRDVGGRGQVLLAPGVLTDAAARVYLACPAAPLARERAMRSCS